MAWDNPQFITGLTASADLSAAANQFKFVELSGDGTVNVCDATTDSPIGVLYNRPKSGESAQVAYGVVKVQGDADLDAGHLIGTSVDGQAANYSVTDTTKTICGKVLVGNAAAAGLVTAFVLPGGFRGPIA